MKTYLVAFSSAGYPSPQFCSAVVKVTKSIETPDNFTVLTTMATKALSHRDQEYRWMPTSCSLLLDHGNDAQYFEVISFELNAGAKAVDDVPSLDTFIDRGKSWVKRNF